MVEFLKRDRCGLRPRICQGKYDDYEQKDSARSDFRRVSYHRLSRAPFLRDEIDDLDGRLVQETISLYPDKGSGVLGVFQQSIESCEVAQNPQLSN
jgi:hypothetical protein